MEAGDSQDAERLEQCHKLLKDLKFTVERLLAVKTSNVWNAYGGLERVSLNIETILCHGIKYKQVTSSEGVFWPFVRGLKWLRPGFTSTMDMVSQLKPVKHGSRGHIWLEKSLQDHTLSSQLKILASDAQHLCYHYKEGAFLRQPDYVDAMLICLHAVDSNKVSALTEIDAKLLYPAKVCPEMSTNVTNISQGPATNNAIQNCQPLTSGSAGEMTKETATSWPILQHLPCSSCFDQEQEQDTSTSLSLCGTPCDDPLMVLHYGASPQLYPASDTEDKSCSGDERTLKGNSIKQNCVGNEVDVLSDSVEHLANTTVHRLPPVSAPRDICVHHLTSDQDCPSTWHDMGYHTLVSSTEENAVHMGVKAHKRSQSDMGIDVGKHCLTSTAHRQADIAKDNAKHSDDNVMVNCGGFQRGISLLQPPVKGQSLVSYLSEQDFNYCALLERENAHFGISEVLISVFEQMKWETFLRKQSLTESGSEDESDDEINKLKQRIRIRRRERLVEKAKRFPGNSDGMNETSTSSNSLIESPHSASQPVSSFSDCSEASDNEEEQIELTFSGTDSSNLARLKSCDLSLSMASLYSVAELGKSVNTVDLEEAKPSDNPWSAEAIALSLLSQFSEKRLPKPSDIEWLVSEKDAPQALLPLPNSYPVSPDDGENADLMQSVNQMKLRGNLEWAPPRPQIIFTVHPPQKRSVVLSRQNMRCAGCGTKIEAAFVKRLRYCEYMGKYFCQCCHNNDTEVVPGRVIQRWDFTAYYVSNFARDLLKNIHSQPLFHIDAININLYNKVRALEAIRDLRQQLSFLGVLLDTCKRSNKWLDSKSSLPKHWIKDDNLFSMEDFAAVKSGTMLSMLKNVVSDGMSHVSMCPLCQGLGFICEICQDVNIIFPFQLGLITLCPVCYACYHKSCFIPGKCPKCSRMELRRKHQSQLSPSDMWTEKSETILEATHVDE